jgi:cytochrome c oxidase assembly factor CtaG
MIHSFSFIRLSFVRSYFFRPLHQSLSANFRFSFIHNPLLALVLLPGWIYEWFFPFFIHSFVIGPYLHESLNANFYFSSFICNRPLLTWESFKHQFLLFIHSFVIGPYLHESLNAKFLLFIHSFVNRPLHESLSTNLCFFIHSQSDLTSMCGYIFMANFHFSFICKLVGL